MTAELEVIDASIDRWCRRTASVERVGPLLLFVEPAPFGPKYARPSTPDVNVTLDDIAALALRQGELDVPVEIEFIAELHPTFADALERWGWTVVRAPLLVHRPGQGADTTNHAISLDMVAIEHDDDRLALVDAIGHVAFSTPGMQVDLSGPDEVAVRARTNDPTSTRERLRLGHMTVMAAFADGGPVAAGSLVLDDGAPIAEIVAIGTVPSHRRQGIGSALTRALVTDARARGMSTVWLSAADRSVAALYERLGFERIGTYAMATGPTR